MISIDFENRNMKTLEVHICFMIPGVFIALLSDNRVPIMHTPCLVPNLRKMVACRTYDNSWSPEYSRNKFGPSVDTNALFPFLLNAFLFQQIRNYMCAENESMKNDVIYSLSNQC